MGIEPTPPAWEAGVLPLNYIRVFSDARQIIQGRSLCVNSKFTDWLLRSVLLEM